MTTQPKGNHRRRRGMLKLNPATRAIRHALALGLAMAAAQPVFAGTCDVSIPSSAKCNGDFVDTTIQYGIDDLTLVVGGDLPTSSDPLDGARGIDLYSSYGAINLTSSADMLVTNASAIFVRSFYGDISIHNTSDGAVTASGTYSNATGIDAGTYYGSNVSIINDGLVDVTVVGYGNATGIRASNFYGNVDVSISDTGSISTSTDTVYGGTAVGVRANTVMGGASVSNAGDITTDATADAGYATAYGIIARGGYYNTTAITNTGDITSTAFSGDGVGWAWGVRARGTDVVVDNQGTISTDADAAYGYATAIATYARGYNSTTTNSGTLIADANVDGYGGAARAYGVMAWGTNASLDNSGTIDTRATIGYGTAVAFGALSYYADHAVQANLHAAPHREIRHYPQRARRPPRRRP